MKNQTFFKFLRHRVAAVIGFLSLAFLLTLFINSGCKKDAATDPVQENLRSHYMVILEANAVKQAAMYDMVKAMSDDYQGELLAKDLTYEQIDAVFAAIARAASYEEDFEKSMLEIEKAAANSQLYKHYPALATTRGIGDAMRGFFSWASGSSKRSRDRILTVASNLSDAERSKLYSGLRPDWKTQTSNEADFWNKVEQGKFDNAASQMYNDFYNDGETDFQDFAIDKGLTIQKIVVKEGAEGIEKGAAVIIETTKLVNPGLGEGIDMVEKGIEYTEKAEKIYKDPKGALVDEIKDKIADKLGGFVDIDGAIDAAGLGEGMGNALKTILDAALGSDDPADWVKDAINWGAAKLIDEDAPGKKMDIVVGESKSTNPNQIPQVVIGVNPENDTEDSSIDLVLPGGEWEITAIDPEGNLDRIITEVVNGVMSIILTNTDPNAKVTDTSYSLSAWVTPADPGPGESVYAYAQIYPKDAGMDIYFEIAGTDGYSNSETIKTDAEGRASFRVPGGSSGTKDVVTVRLVKTGATRTLSYVF